MTIADSHIAVARPEVGEPARTMGQTLHKWGTYLSVDWIYNATAGAAFAYWGKFTPSGQKYWSKPVDRAFETMLKPLIKNPENLKWSVGQGNTFMSIIAGGMLTIPPLLMLEKPEVKLSIAKKFDQLIYGKEKVESDPRFQKAYDEIGNEPKKDFWTGMTSRFAALAPLLASVLFPPTRDLLKKHVFEKVGAASKTVVANAGLPASALFKKHSLAEQKVRWNYIHDDAIAMDLSFGLPYAALHAYFYDKFAKENKDLEDKAHATELAAQEKKFADKVSPKERPHKAESHGAFIASQPEPSMGVAV